MFKQFLTTVILAILLMGAASPKHKTCYQYGVTFTGNWTAEAKEKVLKGVVAASNALTTYLDMKSDCTFRQIFGPIEFRSAGANVDYYAISYGRVILARPKKITERLIVHELGHTLDQRITAINLRYAPHFLLIQYGVYDQTGNFITGTIAGEYHRDFRRAAPQNGYYSDIYTQEYQWHPRRMAGGNCAKEDWADMFMNWVYQSFVPNNAGNARNAWVDRHMPLWLKMLTE